MTCAQSSSMRSTKDSTCRTATASTTLGTNVGAQSSALYEQTDQVMDARVFRIAVTARF